MPSLWISWGLAAVVVLVGGCGSIAVKSTPPEAEVSVLLPGKETPKALGKTPYAADLSALEEVVNEGTIVIVVAKRGYVSQQFVVPNLSGGELEIEANLEPNLPSNYQEVNRVVSLVLQAERYLFENRLKEALETAAEIKKVNENVATAYEIEATAHFLGNDMEKSRFAWIRALELEPSNAEAQAMLAQVEAKLGVKPRTPVEGKTP
jgi:tetratricopeptide (TPR) repeat protein